MGRVYAELLPLGPGNDNEFDDRDDDASGSEMDEDDEDEEDEDEDEVFQRSLFVCRTCKAHLVKGTELVSKDFRGRSGQAYLFNCAANVLAGAPEDRQLSTGLHTVADVSCIDCSQPLGWKYLHAFDERQRYKVGKVILEAALITQQVDGRPRIHLNSAGQDRRPSATSSSSSSSED